MCSLWGGEGGGEKRVMKPKQIQLKTEKLWTMLMWMRWDSPVWHTLQQLHLPFSFSFAVSIRPSSSFCFVWAVRPDASCYLTVCLAAWIHRRETGQRTRLKKWEERGKNGFFSVCSFLQSQHGWEVTSAGDGSSATPASWLWWYRCCLLLWTRLIPFSFWIIFFFLPFLLTFYFSSLTF